MMDNFTKYVEAVAIPNQEAATVAEALVNTVIVRYGAPLQILTDRGTNFEGHLFKELCRLLEIDKVRTTSYHPSGNGLIERFHRTLNAMIGKVVSRHQRDWEEFLPHVLAAYRSSVHEVTGFSPNFLLFARENRAPLDLVYGRPSDAWPTGATYVSYVEEMADRMETAYREVREILQKSAERRKHGYDLRVREAVFKEGDKVWYFSHRRYKGRSPKWEKAYSGPYTVLRRCGAINYVLQRSKNSPSFVAHVDKLKLFWTDAIDNSENEGGKRENATSESQQRQKKDGQKNKAKTVEGFINADQQEESCNERLRPRRSVRKPIRFQ